MAGRPFGSPPSVISSNPWIPVRDFSRSRPFDETSVADPDRTRGISILWFLLGAKETSDSAPLSGSLM